LVFADQDRVEAGFTVTRNGDLDVSVASQNALAGGAVAVVLARIRGPVLGQMVVELGCHQTVQQGSLQLAQQAVLVQDRGWVTAGK
jgi:hypothetical protein